MSRSAREFIQSLLRSRGYELRKKIPNANLDAVRLLIAYYFAAQKPVTVVQIGASDGTHSDPLHDFLLQGRVRTLLVEPMPYSCTRLRELYEGVPNVSIVQAAIYTEDRPVKLYGVKKDSPFYGTPDSMLLASFDRQNLVKCGIPDRDIEAVEVPAFSLKSLFDQQSVTRVDLLQIDTEGFDGEIVKMALQLPVLPEAINFEKKLLGISQLREVYQLLEAKGYLFLHDEMNTLAVQQSLNDKWAKGE